MSEPACPMTEQCILDLSAARAADGATAAFALAPVLMGEARRRGFSRFILVGGGTGADALAGADTIAVPDLPAAAPYLAPSALALDAGRWFDFNWLDLAVNLPSTAGAVAAVPKGEGDLLRGGVALVRRDALLPGAGGIFARLAALAEAGGLATRAYDAPVLDPTGVDPDALMDRVARRRRRPAAFLDRDGVLNVDRGYVHALQDFTWIPGAKAAVKRFNDLGWYVFVVTNQSGIGRGYYVEEDVWTLHRHMQAELRQAGAYLDDWRYCPFHPQGTIARYRQAHPWRKPEPGMLLDLMANWPVAKEHSLLIGDKDTDMAAARAAGVAGYLFRSGSLSGFVEGLGAVPAPA